MRKRLGLKIGVWIVLSVTITFIATRIFAVDFETLRNFIDKAGIYAPIVYVLILYLGLTVPFNPVSDLLTVTIAAALFNPLVGALSTLIVHCLALITNYWLARVYGQRIIEKFATEKETSYLAKLSKNIKSATIFGLRFILPINALGFDVISYAAGFEKMHFRNFFLASIIPWTILNFLYFFGTSFLRSLSSWLFFLPAAILIATPPLILALWRRRKS